MIVKEKTVVIDKETNEVLSTKNRLTINDPNLTNPKRRIYITKPACRNHKLKKETELIENTDMYIVDDRYVGQEIKRILGYPEYKRIPLRELYNSPYIYNADIKMETLVRMAYQKKEQHPVYVFEKGYLDIEQSVLGCDRINAVTYIHENQIFTYILNDFMKVFSDKKYVRKATEKDIRKAIATDLGTLDGDELHIKIDKSDKYKVDIDQRFKLHLKFFDREDDLLKELFQDIHRMESDYISIWNIDYDVPQIAKRLEYYNLEPKDIFSHPDVPEEWRYWSYKPDKKKTQHITDKWHWLSCTSMSQWIDQMLLYSRVRKHKRKQPTYSLDHICNVELGFGKLMMHKEDVPPGKEWHIHMQSYEFVDYVVYNIQDVLLLKFLEDKNNDISALFGLSEHSQLADFSKQAAMLKDSYYKFATDHGRVLATTGNNMHGPYDHYIGKQGGAVLKADLTKDIGMKCIVEKPDYESMILVMCSDLDYKAIYPSYKSGYGISKETKIATTVEIEGQPTTEIEPLYGALANPEENAVWVGHQYFNLPSYEEMEESLKSILEQYA
jgi:hypothetical protein